MVALLPLLVSAAAVAGDPDGACYVWGYKASNCSDHEANPGGRHNLVGNTFVNANSAAECLQMCEKFFPGCTHVTLSRSDDEANVRCWPSSGHLPSIETDEFVKTPGPMTTQPITISGGSVYCYTKHPCGKDKEMLTANGEVNAKIAHILELENRNRVVFSTDHDPHGKAAKHVPTVTWNADKHGSHATIVVPHGMKWDGETPHMIEHIYAKDQTGALIFHEEFKHGDKDAAVKFKVPDGATSITGFAYCNQHGLWRSAETTVHKRIKGEL